MKSKPVSAGSGVLAGGNWIIDQVKLIDVYPQPEQLANISSQAQGTGGAPYNVLIDLAKLGVSFPLFAAGLVGKDAFGQSILDDCKKHRIDTRFLRTTAGAPTSYTDVMTEVNGGRRTFFHHRTGSWQNVRLQGPPTRRQARHGGASPCCRRAVANGCARTGGDSFSRR